MTASREAAASAAAAGLDGGIHSEEAEAGTLLPSGGDGGTAWTASTAGARHAASSRMRTLPVPTRTIDGCRLVWAHNSGLQV